jgi:hypothetical protein
MASSVFVCCELSLLWSMLHAVCGCGSTAAAAAAELMMPVARLSCASCMVLQMWAVLVACRHLPVYLGCCYVRGTAVVTCHLRTAREPTPRRPISSADSSACMRQQHAPPEAQAVLVRSPLPCLGLAHHAAMLLLHSVLLRQAAITLLRCPGCSSAASGTSPAP